MSEQFPDWATTFFEIDKIIVRGLHLNCIQLRQKKKRLCERRVIKSWSRYKFRNAILPAVESRNFARAVTFRICIWELPGSNIGREKSYSFIFRGFC
jgi:hypothetical protein